MWSDLLWGKRVSRARYWARTYDEEYGGRVPQPHGELQTARTERLAWLAIWLAVAGIVIAVAGIAITLF